MGGGGAGHKQSIQLVLEKKRNKLGKRTQQAHGVQFQMWPVAVFKEAELESEHQRPNANAGREGPGDPSVLLRGVVRVSIAGCRGRGREHALLQSVGLHE